MIIGILKPIVYGLPSTPGITLKPGTKSWQNLIADEQTSPAVYMDVPLTVDWLNMNNLAESYPVRMIFLTKSELEDDPDAHEQAFNFLRQMAREFISGCVQAASIASIENCRGVHVWNAYDANFDALILSCTIKPNMNQPVC